MHKSKMVALVGVFVLALLFVACGAPEMGGRSGSVASQASTAQQNQSLDVQVGADYTIDTTIFKNKIQEYFSGKVKGYQVALVRNNTLVAEAASGYARLHWNDPENYQGLNLETMTTSHYANVGSTAKFPVAIALLAVMEHKYKAFGGAATLLNSKIYYHLPKAWQAISHQTIKKITFRDLITHKSGFAQGDRVYVADRLKKGVDTIDKCTPNASIDNLPTDPAYCHGVRKYSNENYRLLGYLLASFEDPQFNNTLDNLKYTDKELGKKLGERFEQVMKTYVFDKLLLRYKPSCDPVNELLQQNRKVAMMYTDRQDWNPGVYYSSKDSLEGLGIGRHCRGQGGWYYSARSLAHLLGTLQTTDRIIPRSLYYSLMDEKGDRPKVNQRMAWSSWHDVRTSVINQRFGWTYLPHHTGSHPVTAPDGRKVYGRSAIVRLPMGYHAVGIINSGGMGSGTITTHLKNAYANAIVLK